MRHVGLYEERYRPIGGYSTGMKQRVKLAQALVHDPQLVLLDEPTNGLDPAGRDEMLGLIRRIGTVFGISVLVTSHLMGELERVCDHVVVIDGGRLLRSASTADVTAVTQQLTVEVTDRQADVAARLVSAGVGARAVGSLLEVELVDETTYDVVRDVVADLGVGLVRLQRSRQHMLDIFRTSDDERRSESVRRHRERGAVTTPGPTGAIHDIGYRHYDGPRLGPTYIARSLFVHSLRGAFGLGRSARTKVMPMLLFAVMILPALIIAAVAIFTDADELPLEYTAYAVNLQIIVAIFVGVSGAAECLARPALSRCGVVLFAPAVSAAPMCRPSCWQCRRPCSCCLLCRCWCSTAVRCSPR